MIRLPLFAFFLAALVLPARAVPAEAPTPQELEASLNLEHKHGGAFPDGWHGGPAETISIDTQVAHTPGKGVVRLERPPDSPEGFSTITKSIPLDFAGEKVELRGYVKTKDVSGFAGLWMREDGTGEMLEFDNMESRQLKGTTDWTEYSVTLPVNPNARRLFFGFLLTGTGTAWGSEFHLKVDGRPIAEAPKAKPTLTILDTDHQFDRGSAVKLGGLSPVQIGNLATLAKVWGYLKYHHPAVISGSYHWDYELFRILPAVLEARDSAIAAEVLDHWVGSLGKVAPGTEGVSPEGDVALRPEVSWIHDSAQLGGPLSEKLSALDARHLKWAETFYVSTTPGVGNPVFTHELAYPDIALPDEGYQLLALFRLWNIVRYWYPYRDLTTGNWDKVLSEFIPRIGLAKDATAYKLQVLALLARVSDSHANLWSSLGVRPPAGALQWPAAVRFIGEQPVVTQVFNAPGGKPSGLERGDIILSIDGKPVADLIEGWSAYYPASNTPTRLRDIAVSMGRGPAGPVKLGVRRGDETIERIVDRIPRSGTNAPKATHDLPGPAFQLLSKDVAYLKLSSVKAADIGSYLLQAAGTKGWIIDIRNYPSDFVVFALGSHLVSSPTPFVRFTVADLSRPGAFSFTEPLLLNPESPHYSGKIVILVDETSQSQSEYTAMAFRSAPGALVVGSTTAGADGNVSPIPLPGGLSTMVSGLGIFYPDKRPTQQVGIVPDVPVSPTPEGIREGRDEVLAEALRQILHPMSAEEERKIRTLATLQD